MSAPPADLLAYHLGFVVHDIEAMMDRYRRLLGINLWRVREVPRQAPPWTAYTDARMKIAFGRGVGLTFELIQVLKGHTQHSEFLATHGEGIQHIGIWSPNLKASVEGAVAEGAVLVNALFEADDIAAVQLTAGSTPGAVIQALGDARLAYVDPGMGGVQLEFVGPSQGMRDWLQQDFAQIIIPPPWES